MKLLPKIFTVFLLLAATFIHAQDISQHIVPNRTNNKKQEKKPYVILISADGFRYDLADKYHSQNLIALRNKGVQAAYMLPCYPSLTFPNHYSIATGLYPARTKPSDNPPAPAKRSIKFMELG